ncbi:hypothetical protein RCH14_001640 [Massilia sp. MP_M2]|uniref:hypothetical protein n=1 Tax=Massilia sp. MP_M2 TaxID=3071713 RepID=UPI00319E59A9
MNQAIVRGLRKAGVIAATATASGLAAAQATAGPDMSGLTSAVDFGTVTTAVLAIAGLLAVVYVAVKGATIGLSMLKK